MKLTLEHLCAYLPHKPQMIFRKSGRIIELNGLWVNENGNLILVDQFGEDWLLKHWNFKPILRHPSSVTKEIEHRGEKFVPLDRLKKINHRDFSLYRPLDPQSDIEIEIQTPDYSVDIDLYDGYRMVKQLHSWMIDTYGLIEAGFAIDVETLDVNPYSK